MPNFTYLQIKEGLSIARKSDSEVKIMIPTQKETFERFIEEAGLRNDGRPSDIGLLAEVLGANWNKRISNSAGDLATVNPETPTFKLSERHS